MDWLFEKKFHRALEASISTTNDRPDEIDQSNSDKPTEQYDITIEVSKHGRIDFSIAGSTSPALDDPSITDHSGNDYKISLPVGGKTQFSILLPTGSTEVITRHPRSLFTRTFAWFRTRFRSWPYSLDMTLFGVGVALYLITRIIGLTEFPGYFFSDEAIQTLLSIDLLRENFHSIDGEFLPTYFYNVDKFSLSTTVYLQLLPYILFGKSVLVTRLTSVILTLMAAVSVGLILRNILKLPYWWCATLLLSITPAWYLHSRTAFETVTMVSFYSIGLYSYLQYRFGKLKYLNWALLLFSLSFYSYNPGQVVVVVTGILLFISDLRYHWQHRKVAIRGLILILILALPYLRFRLIHPAAIEDHLSTLGSYWIKPIPFADKIREYFSEYFYGLSPGYWFVSNGRDLIRHKFNDQGNLIKASLPFVVLGLFQAIRNIRNSGYRAILISLVAAPTGAALVQIAITRALVMVIPAVLLGAIGIILLLVWSEKYVSRKIISISLFVLLSILNINMTRDALVNGPYWFNNYGLTGLQYGASEVFGSIEEYQKAHPDHQVVVSPTWTNGADIVARFFLGDPLPIKMQTIQAHINHREELSDTMLFVVPEEEYNLILESGKFTDVRIERILNYPDGTPGFYFLHLSYVDNIDEIMAAEKEERRELREAELNIDGVNAQVRYSLLDLGEINSLWDNNKRSVTRTFEANPYVIEIIFSESFPMSGFSAIIGDTEVDIVATLLDGSSEKPREFIFEGLRGTVSDPMVAVDFGDTYDVNSLHLEFRDLRQTEPAHVHIWEIEFLQGDQE